MMKKIITLFLVGVIGLSLVACGGKEVETSADASPKEIEITADNWQEYFEEKEVISVTNNAFGEAERIAIHQIIAPKDKYIIDENKSNIAVEYTFHTEEYYVDIDFETWEYTYGEKVEDEIAVMSRSGSTIREFGSNRYPLEDNSQTIYCLDYSGYGDFYTREDEETKRRITEVFFIDDIIRIQGTIFVKEK